VRKSNANSVICGFTRGSSSVQIRGAAHMKLRVVKVKKLTGLILREYLEMKRNGITSYELGRTIERIVFKDMPNSQQVKFKFPYFSSQCDN